MRKYNPNSDPLLQPTPAQVREIRLMLGHTQSHACSLVYRTDTARWREWEREGPSGRVIDLAIWECYLLKSGVRNFK